MSTSLLSIDIHPLPSNSYPGATKRVPCLLSSINYFLYPSSTPKTLPTKRLPHCPRCTFLYLLIPILTPAAPTYQTTPKSTFLLSFDILPLPSNPYLPHESQAYYLFFIFDTILTYLPNDSHDSRNAHVNFAQYLFSNRKYRKGRVRAMAAPSSEDNRKRCPRFFAG